MPPRVILTDIEGTTSRVAFVHDVLFPYARTHLPALLAERSADPEVAAALAEVDRLAPGTDRLAALLGWMDQDAKITPLKTLQGIVWRDGYARGELKGDLYPDVAPCLRTWASDGVRLFVYSSGSVAAQRLIFGHSTAGDLTGLFAGFFDTHIGAKRDAASYARIAAEVGAAPDAILFLSDVEAELDAATEADLATCQLVRAEDRTVPSDTHATAADFFAVAQSFGLKSDRAA